jgi:hypothetical protein
MTTKRRIPADSAKVDQTRLTPEDWERAERASEEFKALVRRRPRAKASYEALLTEIQARQTTLAKLRQARALTQTTVAELLDMDQSEVSRLERRSDLLLSTLRRFIQATGGDLKVIAVYPDSEPVEVLVGDEETRP